MLKGFELGRSFHRVTNLTTLQTGRHFFPGGPKVLLRDFQRLLYAERGKISIALALLQEYGLSPKVRLGEKTVLEQKSCLAEYLYQASIHPRFFAVALHLVASQTKELDGVVQKVLLRNLRRENIERALLNGQITAKELGVNFKIFEEKPAREKLQILSRLNIFVLAPGKDLSKIVAGKSPSETPVQSCMETTSGKALAAKLTKAPKKQLGFPFK